MRRPIDAVQWAHKPAFPFGLPTGEQTKHLIGDVIEFSLLGTTNLTFNSPASAPVELGTPLLNSWWDVVRHLLVLPIPLTMTVEQTGAGEKEAVVAIEGEIAYQLLIDGVVVGEESIPFTQAKTKHGPTVLKNKWTVFENLSIGFSFIPPFQISLPGGHVLQFDIKVKNMIISGEVPKGSNAFTVTVRSTTSGLAGEENTFANSSKSILAYVVHSNRG